MTTMLRLMWKEYRVLRGFWMALAIFGLACDGLAILLVPNSQDRLPGLFGLAGVLPACFALGAGATLFALEREESTRELLQFLPLTSLRIFTSKVSVALGGTLLLTLLLLSVALGVAFGNMTAARLAGEDALTGAAEAAGVHGIIVLQAMGWSVFFSLRSARPLSAACLGALGALVCLGVVHFLAQPSGSFNARQSQAWTIPLADVVATAAIWLIDVRLGSAWLHGRRAGVSIRPARAARRTRLNRLLWQEWRSSRRVLVVLFVLGVLLPLLQWADPYSGGIGAVPAVGIVLALFGACTFLGDQERSQFRFFADRGVSGRSVWFHRLLFWLGSASVLALILFLAHLLWVPSALPHLSASVNPATVMRTQTVLSWFAVHLGPTETAPAGRAIGWLTDFSGYAVWLALAFGAGQLCSMFFRSGLLAAVFGIILAGPLLAWAALMSLLNIGWWWSVAPLAIALFAATWLRADGWVLERRRFSAWLPSALVLAMPAATVLTAVPICRVFEIPKVDVEQFRPQRESSANAGPNDAVVHLLWTSERLPGLRLLDLEALSDDVPPEDQEWLTANQGALDGVLEALSRVPADAAMEDISPIQATHWQQITAMLIRSGQAAESHGDLDAAWTRYRAVLDLARLVRRRSAVLGYVLGESMERAALAQLTHWGARDGQTVERLRAAVDVLQQLAPQDELLADVVRHEYRKDLAYLNEAMQARLHPADATSNFAAKWAPWEFTRARRLLRYEAFLDIQDARSADAAFAKGTTVRAASQQSDRANADLLLQTTLLPPPMPIEGVIEARRLTLRRRSATEVALADELRRLERGEMPAKLED
jgi:hypothetical protein